MPKPMLEQRETRRLRWCCYVSLLLCLWPLTSLAKPAVYLFLDGGPAKQYQALLDNPQIQGAQIIYSWKSLEPQPGVYDFSAIEADLAFLQSIHKQLFIQIQDRSFSPTVIPVPAYLLSPQYDGGVAQQTDFSGPQHPISVGWVAQQWQPRVQQQFQALLRALGQRFDGKIAGINLPETAIDLDHKHLPPGFTCDRYFQAVLANMTVLHTAFPHSAVVQYVNFFPCEWNNDHHYMSRLFAYAAANHIGLGGPDVLPYWHGQMKNSYPFFHRDHGQLPWVAFAVQEPDYTYKNSRTGQRYTAQELYDFATHYLGATVLFWNVQQPQYNNEVLPLLKNPL